MRKQIILAAVGSVTTLGILAGIEVTKIRREAARYEMFGGRENYERQRAAFLERLINQADQTVPHLRQQELDSLQSEIDELGRDVPARELGEELRIK
jgi:hypothetical protein